MSGQYLTLKTGLLAALSSLAIYSFSGNEPGPLRISSSLVSTVVDANVTLLGQGEWLVLVTVPWAPRSQLQETWEDLCFLDPTVKLAMVNGVQNPGLVASLFVSKYPSVVHLKHNTIRHPFLASLSVDRFQEYLEWGWKNEQPIGSLAPPPILKKLQIEIFNMVCGWIHREPSPFCIHSQVPIHIAVGCGLAVGIVIISKRNLFRA